MLDYIYKHNRIDGIVYKDIPLKLIFMYPNRNMVFASSFAEGHYLLIFTSNTYPEKYYVYDAAKEQEIINEGFKGLELKAIAWSIDLWTKELKRYTVDELQRVNHVYE